MSTQRCLVVVMTLQTLTLLGLWAGVPSTQRVQAQIPDGGAQRAATLDELKAVNANLERLITILTDGKLQVHVATPDEKK